MQNSNFQNFFLNKFHVVFHIESLCVKDYLDSSKIVYSHSREADDDHRYFGFTKISILLKCRLPFNPCHLKVVNQMYTIVLI